MVSDDHLGIAAHDFVSQIGVPFGLTYCGIALDDEIATLGVAAPTHRSEKLPHHRGPRRFGQFLGRDGRRNEDDAVLLRRRLRPRELRRGGEQQADCEFAAAYQ